MDSYVQKKSVNITVVQYYDTLYHQTIDTHQIFHLLVSQGINLLSGLNYTVKIWHFAMWHFDKATVSLQSTSGVRLIHQNDLVPFNLLVASIGRNQ